MTTRVAGASAVAIAAALIAASTGGTHAVKEGGTLRVGIPGDFVDSIDPALTGVAGTATIVRATCAGLMTTPDKPLPEGLRVVPELARADPVVSKNRKAYTFTIRKDARFSNGAPVTAADVAHTIDRILNPAMKAYAAGFLTDIVGARDVLDGKAQTVAGVTARGRSLTIRLTRPLGDLSARLARAVCVVPRTLAADPEGAKPPVPTPAPYSIAEYVPGRRIVLARNRFYRGTRPHHVDRIVIDLTPDSATALAQVESGALDFAWIPTADYADRAQELRRKYGLNRSRFFAAPISFLRLFVLNTSRPLFRNNLELRQAVNFAVDRKALLRERGPLAGFLTDQYLSPGMPGFRDERIYPLQKPDLKRARALAKGNLRSGKAVLYTIAFPLGRAQAQIVKTGLGKIGITVEIKEFPPDVLFDKLATRGEPFDVGWIGWLADLPDPSYLNDLFERGGIGNYSHFDSTKYNRLLRRASRLTGRRRYREYGQLDRDLARNAAPAIAYAYDNALTLVSARTGCVVLNPYLDLAAVCLR